MKPASDAILIVAENRKARHEYEIIKVYEAGLVLQGSEVKSIRDSQIQLKDAYVSFRGDEAFLQNAHIAVHKPSSYNNHEPERVRKLLLNRHELNAIMESIQEKGLTCVALKVYFKKGRAKVELAIARGKKLHDKRESIKKRDAAMELKRSLQKTRRG
jgi:SsrA-binding protein